jgi:hypothetical protein
MAALIREQGHFDPGLFQTETLITLMFMMAGKRSGIMAGLFSTNLSIRNILVSSINN